MMATCSCGRYVSAPRRRYCSYTCQALGSRLAFYGIDAEDFLLLLQRQGGRCAICAKTLTISPEVRPPSVDHDHVTGQVRGVLCHGCNLRVGWFEQARKSGSQVLSQQIDGFATKIADYLNRHAAESAAGRTKGRVPHQRFA